MMEAGRTDIHDLLPWHVAGLLETDEASAFERHLASCRLCRQEIGLLASLREEIERSGEAFFLPHPAPESIVTEVLEGLPEPQSGELRRHLSFCSTCATEARIVRQSQSGVVEATLPPTARSRPVWRRALPWVAAVAVILAVALPVWQRDAPGRRSDVVSTYYVEPPQRATADTVVRVPASATGFQIVVPVELASESYPLSVEIRDSEGGRIFSRDDVTAVYRGQFLFVYCDRRDFPDADYLVLVRPHGPPVGRRALPLEFRFRVSTE